MSAARTSAIHPKDLLSSFGFLAALSLLLLNDLVLKAASGGFVTGKLSDFAGLFVFPVFWTAFMPRHRRLIHWSTAIAFVWWKLPASAPFIEFWNSRAPLPIGRTEDLTDLVALSAVIGAYWFTSRPRRQVSIAAPRWVIVPIALFAFGATTFMTVKTYDRTYAFRTDPITLRRSLEQLGIRRWVEADSTPASSAAENGLGPLNVRIPTGCCIDFGANLVVLEDSAGSAVAVLRLSSGGRAGDELINMFEQCFVQRLDSLLTDGRSVRATSQPVDPKRRWC